MAPAAIRTATYHRSSVFLLLRAQTMLLCLASTGADCRRVLSSANCNGRRGPQPQARPAAMARPPEQPQLVSLRTNPAPGGKSPFLSCESGDAKLVSSGSWTFAHEAPVWLPRTGEVLMASSRLRDADGGQTIALLALGLGTGLFRNLDTSPPRPMPNGATIVPAGHGPFPESDTVVLAYQGYGSDHGGLAFFDTATGESITIVDSFPCPENPDETCVFNSPNDVIFDAEQTGLWFTDPSYGFQQGFLGALGGPQAIYFFDLNTTQLRVASLEFEQPNGVLLSEDGQTVYVTDAKKNESRPKVPYRVVACDVLPGGELGPRQEFPVVGFPDGLKADALGNIYVATSSGVEVLSAEGAPLAVLGVEGGVSNLVFGGEDYTTLIMLNGQRVISLPIAATGDLQV